MSYDLKPGLSKLGKNLISSVTDPEKQELMKVIKDYLLCRIIVTIIETGIECSCIGKWCD
jgi:hypothetical protein